MNVSAYRSYRLPLEEELDLHRLTNATGIEISILPNGGIFAIEHVSGDERVLINQIFGSPLGGGMGRVLLRLRDGSRKVVPVAGASASGQIGYTSDRFVWAGDITSLRHQVTLWLHPQEPVWLWLVELENAGSAVIDCDAILIQDLGLGARGFVLSNEAYASQYIDHTIAEHPNFGPVVMSRQNMAQFGRHPWVAHGCLDGAASFATDASQIFGSEFRQTGEDTSGFGVGLPGTKLQGEAACAAIQSQPIVLAPGGKASLRFFGFYEPGHPAATNDTDLAGLETIEKAAREFQPASVKLFTPARSVFQQSAPLSCTTPSYEAIKQRYPQRMHEERQGAELLSFLRRTEHRTDISFLPPKSSV